MIIDSADTKNTICCVVHVSEKTMAVFFHKIIILKLVINTKEKFLLKKTGFRIMKIELAQPIAQQLRRGFPRIGKARKYSVRGGGNAEKEREVFMGKQKKRHIQRILCGWLVSAMIATSLVVPDMTAYAAPADGVETVAEDNGGQSEETPENQGGGVKG